MSATRCAPLKTQQKPPNSVSRPVAEPPTASATQAAFSALKSFIEAVEAGQFDVALSGMSSDWRARYTAPRLKADFDAEPLSRERLNRARWALTHGRWEASPSVGEKAEVRLTISEGKAVRLVSENDGWKISRLE